MMKIFKWNGQYFGYIYNGYLFNSVGEYLGWVEGKAVWNSNGHFLGEIVENMYILRRQILIPTFPKMARVPPPPTVPPVPSLNVMARIPKLGWLDALDDY